LKQQAIDAAPHPPQLERRRVPELGNGRNAGPLKPLLHAPPDAVNVLQVEAEQDSR
jgi:hypothetical protein